MYSVRWVVSLAQPRQRGGEKKKGWWIGEENEIGAFGHADAIFFFFVSFFQKFSANKFDHVAFSFILFGIVSPPVYDATG